MQGRSIAFGGGVGAETVGGRGAGGGVGTDSALASGGVGATCARSAQLVSRRTRPRRGRARRGIVRIIARRAMYRGVGIATHGVES